MGKQGLTETFRETSAQLAQPEQEPVAWLLTDKNINSLQVDSIQRLIDRLKHAHHTDLCVRINGQDEWFQADWLKHMVRVTPPLPEQDDRRLQIAMRQWEDWKTYALELEGEVIGYKQILDAQRPWVGLTDEEMYEAVRTLCKADSVARSLFDVSKDEYRAIEAKLKDKNT